VAQTRDAGADNKGDPHHPIRTYARRVNREQLGFTSEDLSQADNAYVGWIDLIGAGHNMSTSVQKSSTSRLLPHLP
jgi:hypothetical protein